MRIAMTNNFFLPRPSGSAHHTEGLAAKLAAAGHEVLVITAAYQNAPSDESRDGYRVIRLPAWTPPPSRVGMNYEIPWTLSCRIISASERPSSAVLMAPPMVTNILPPDASNSL